MSRYLVLLLVLLLSGCTDPATARRLAEQDGVTQVTTTGYAWLACGKDDWYATGFQGFKNGQRVRGVVCGGLLWKANTVRYE